jgi:hypothetical protein
MWVDFELAPNERGSPRFGCYFACSKFDGTCQMVGAQVCSIEALAVMP